MKGKWKTKSRDLVLGALQVTLIVVCIGAIVTMDLWEVGEKILTSDGQESVFSPTNGEVGEDNVAKKEENEQQQTQEQIDEPEYVPVVADSVWRSQGNSVEERCANLLADSTAYRQGKVDYAYLLDNPVFFGHDRVFLAYDELAYLFMQVVLSTTQKAKTCYFRSAKATNVGGKNVHLQVEVEFVLTNKLLALMYGKGSQRLTLDLDLVLDGGVNMKDMTITAEKEIGDKLLSLGSDVLFGTTDYKGYVRKLLATTTSNLGRVVEAQKTGFLLSTTKK